MAWKNRIHLTVRGFQTINELMPGYFPFAAAKAILEAFLPFISIYMSGRIVTAWHKRRAGGNWWFWY